MAKVRPLPIWLQQTEAQKQQDRELQEIRRASFGRVKMTDEERLVSRSALMEETGQGNAQAALNDYERIINGAVKAKRELPPDEVRELVRRVRHGQRMMAEGMAMQGKYGQASQAHPDVHKQIEYQGIKEAIERDDEEMCDCRGTRAHVYKDENGKERTSVLKEDEKPRGPVIEIPAVNVHAEIYSLKHKGIVGLHRCNECGEMNAKPVDGHLQARLKGQAESHKLVDSGKGIAHLSDVQLLRSLG